MKILLDPLPAAGGGTSAADLSQTLESFEGAGFEVVEETPAAETVTPAPSKPADKPIRGDLF